MSNGFIPGSDSQFSTFAQTLTSVIKTDPSVYGIDAAKLTELENGLAAWDGSVSDQALKREASKAATVTKDEERKNLESLIRELNSQIQADPNVPESAIADAGLPVHSTSRTPAPVPTTAPLASIQSCNIQENYIRFSDSQNIQSRVRPRGVMGVEIWMYCGDEAPTDNGQFQMYTLTTRMSATVAFDGTQAGKGVWYRFRYVNTRGDVGPWSMTYTSTVVK